MGPPVAMATTETGAAWVEANLQGRRIVGPGHSRLSHDQISVFIERAMKLRAGLWA